MSMNTYSSYWMWSFMFTFVLWFWHTDKDFHLSSQETGAEHSWPVAAAGGLANGMEHIGLLAVPNQARKDQYRGASRGFWVGRTGLIVHPVQRNLTTINCTDELPEG